VSFKNLPSHLLINGCLRAHRCQLFGECENADSLDTIRYWIAIITGVDGKGTFRLQIFKSLIKAPPQLGVQPALFLCPIEDCLYNPSPDRLPHRLPVQ
jgi:hypothetical protein